MVMSLVRLGLTVFCKLYSLMVFVCNNNNNKKDGEKLKS